MKALQFVILVWVLISSAQAWADKAEKAKVITGHNRAAQCISPIQVRKIDGREAAVQSMGFSLEPGTHTLTGSAKIDTSMCKTVGRGTGRNKIEPLEADFEAGKTYWVGYDHSASDRKEWKLVIWKVE
jgi:hypothetical protein